MTRKYGQSEVEKRAIQFSCKVLLNLSAFLPAAIIIAASVKHPYWHSPSIIHCYYTTWFTQPWHVESSVDKDKIYLYQFDGDYFWVAIIYYCQTGNHFFFAWSKLTIWKLGLHFRESAIQPMIICWKASKSRSCRILFLTVRAGPGYKDVLVCLDLKGTEAIFKGANFSQYIFCTFCIGLSQVCEADSTSKPFFWAWYCCCRS